MINNRVIDTLTSFFFLHCANSRQKIFGRYGVKKDIYSSKGTYVRVKISL